MAGCFALVPPLFTIGVKNTIAQKFMQRIIEFGTLQVVFKITWNEWFINMSVCFFLKYTTYVDWENTFQKVFNVFRIDSENSSRVSSNS